MIMTSCSPKIAPTTAPMATTIKEESTPIPIGTEKPSNSVQQTSIPKQQSSTPSPKPTPKNSGVDSPLKLKLEGKWIAISFWNQDGSPVELPHDVSEPEYCSVYSFNQNVFSDDINYLNYTWISKDTILTEKDTDGISMKIKVSFNGDKLILCMTGYEDLISYYECIRYDSQ